MTRHLSRPVAGGFVVASILLAALAIHSAPTAGAHAVLESSSPSDQSVLTGSPARVRLTFSEAVTLVPGAVRVFDEQGERVDEGLATHAGSSEQVAVGLKPDLATGSYAVSWRVVSADAHPVHGGFVFSVRHEGQVEGLDDLIAPSSRPGLEGAAAVLRGLGYIGSLAVVGAALFVAFVRRGGGAHPREVALLTVAAAVAVVSQILGVPIAAAQATGEGLGSVFSQGVLGELLGQGVVVTIAGVAVAMALGLATLRVDGRGRRVSSLAALVVLTGAFVASGHTRTADPAWVMSIVDAVHVAAAAVWIGGIGMLVVSLRRRRRARASDDHQAGDAGVQADLGDPAEAAAEVARFSRLATGSIVAIGLAGLVMAYLEIRSLRALVETAYGRLVLAKVALMVILAGLGAFNHFRLLPALRARPDRPARWRYLERTLRGEALALLAVLGVTAVLVTSVPGRTAVATQAIYSVSAPLGGGEAPGSVNLVIDPARTGPTALHLYLLDAQGRPDDEVKSVAVRLTQSAVGIGPIDEELRRAGPGHYVVNGTLFTVPGDWTIDVAVRVDEFTEHSAELQAAIRN